MNGINVSKSLAGLSFAEFKQWLQRRPYHKSVDAEALYLEIGGKLPPVKKEKKAKTTKKEEGADK